MFCDSCGQQVPERARFCQDCGRQFPLPSPIAPPPISSQGTLAQGNSGRKRPVLILICCILGLFVLIILTTRQRPEMPQLEAGNQSQPSTRPSPASTAPPEKPLDPAVQRTQQNADEFALNLQRKFERNGYDVAVRANHQHELILAGDPFQDPMTRDSAAGELAKDPKTLCNLGIWYIKVGYSKSMLSGDVMKSVSIGCSAAKAEELTETEPLREEITRAANDPDGSGRIHVHAHGTTLVVESAYFFDDPQNGVTYATAFAQNLLANSQKLCAAAISQLQMKGSKKVIKTVPVACN
jgi:hypothetical protein